MSPFTSATFLAALLLTTRATAQGALQINTPGGTYQCQSAQFSYTCDSPPCTVVARPTADVSSSLHSFPTVNDNAGSVGWQPVDQPEGCAESLSLPTNLSCLSCLSLLVPPARVETEIFSFSRRTEQATPCGSPTPSGSRSRALRWSSPPAQTTSGPSCLRLLLLLDLTFFSPPPASTVEARPLPLPPLPPLPSLPPPRPLRPPRPLVVGPLPPPPTLLPSPLQSSQQHRARSLPPHPSPRRSSPLRRPEPSGMPPVSPAD
jgi:hypothetical protein